MAITWSTPSLPNTGNTWYLRDIVWAPELNSGAGLFVAVGQKLAGADTSCFRTSPDGVTWTTRTAPQANQWRGVTWSPPTGNGLLVATSTDGANRVATSSDGITWTAQAASAVVGWRGVTWAPSLHLYCAVAAGTTTIQTSPDGVTWTSQAGAASKQWAGICWSPDLSLFVAVATSSGTQSIQTSPDGINWTIQSHPALLTSSGPVSGNSIVCWSPTAHLFCAMVETTAQDGTALTSPDGITWTASTMPTGTNDADEWLDVVPSASGFTIFSQRFGLGTANSCVATSTDGLTWTTQDPTITGGVPGGSGAYASAIRTYVFGRLQTDSVLLGVDNTPMSLTGDVTMAASAALTVSGGLTAEGSLSVAVAPVYDAGTALVTTEGDVTITATPIINPSGSGVNASTPTVITVPSPFPVGAPPSGGGGSTNASGLWWGLDRIDVKTRDEGHK